VAKRAKGSSRHSFYQPRLTVYSPVTLSTERGIMGWTVIGCCQSLRGA